MPHFDRLTRMADMLEREAKRGHWRIDLNHWGCGTIACAMGLAVATGEFKKEGLCSWLGDDYTPAIHISGDPLKDPSGFEAIRLLFDIDHDTAYYFFSAIQYPVHIRNGQKAVDEVVRRIRAFVNVESDRRTIREVIAEEESRKVKKRELETV